MTTNPYQLTGERPLAQLLHSDLFRIRRRYGFLELLIQLLTNRAFRPVFTYRMCRWSRQPRLSLARILFPFFYLLHRYSTGRLCCEIPLRTNIGAGFLLVHGYCVVINESAVIGENVTILHQVTIGRSAKGTPTIGNGVVIAAHALVLGPSFIGDNATIGAGSVVLNDVPANSVAAGNPAQLIATNTPGRARNTDYVLA